MTVAMVMADVLMVTEVVVVLLEMVVDVVMVTEVVVVLWMMVVDVVLETEVVVVRLVMWWRRGALVVVVVVVQQEKQFCDMNQVVQCVVVCAREVEVVVAMQVEQFFVGVQDTSE